MKKIMLFCIGLFTTAILGAQSPAAFSYQAVVRDASGGVKANQNVSFRISILAGSSAGTVLFSETHSARTNEFGLVTLQIGKGTNITGNLGAIDWGGNWHFLKIEMDPSGGTSYVLMGTTQLVSVPYAFNARTVEIDQVNDADADPNNELQELSLNGTQLSLTKGGGTVTIPSGSGDNWGTQAVLTDATLTGNGTTALPLMVADNGITSVKISDGAVGNSDLAGDAVTSGKIQDGSIAAADLAEQSVTAVKLGNLAVGTEKIQSGAVTPDKIAAGAVTGAKIAQAGATNGQALKWNGTTWAPAEDETGGGGLTLPYAGTAASNEAVLKITNNLASEQYDGIGIMGVSGDVNGIGLVGQSTNINGQGIGVEGIGSSGAGIGVLGFVPKTTGTNYGVIGRSLSSTGVGVYGHAQESTGMNYGVIGQTLSSTGYAGYFEGGRFYVGGNVGIGNLNPGAKLEVTGQVKITGGNPGAGKVLTSDATGLATWQASAASPWIVSGNSIYYNNGPVGIGVTNPANVLELKGYSATYVKFFTTSSGINGEDGAVMGLSPSASGHSAWLWNYETGDIVLGTNNQSRMTINNAGYVGIGKSDPEYELDVAGKRIRLISGTEWIAMRTDGSPGFLDLSFGAGHLVIQGSVAGEHVILNPSMNRVGIRTWTPQYDLDVNGSIRATGSVYYGGTTGAADGTAYIKPDFVFELDYDKMETEQVEEFLTREKHLPWVTSAIQEKKENGTATNMTRMAFETLESVENIQLQVIRQAQRIRELENENLRLKAVNSTQQSRIDKIESRLARLESQSK